MANLSKKPNGIYVLNVKVPDEKTGELKRQRVSCETRDYEEAKAVRTEWIAGRHPKHPSNGGIVAAKGREPESRVSRVDLSNGMTLAVWLTRCLDTIWRRPDAEGKGCKSWKSSQSNAKVLAKFIEPEVLLVDVDTAYLKTLKEKLTDKGYAAATIRRKMMAISAALTEATTMDQTEGEPLLTHRPRMPKLEKSNNTQDRVVARVEEEAIFDAIDARIASDPSRPWWQFRAYVTIGLDLGFRSSETLFMGPSCIREKRWMNPTTGEMESGFFLGIPRYVAKNDKPRDVPCTDRVAALFPALNAMASKGKWFPWQKGGSGVWYMWNNIREDLSQMGFDLSDVKLHTFRHTCATRLAEGGLDLVSLRDWLGHSDIKITAERYVHLMATHLHRGAIILNGGKLTQEVPTQDLQSPKGEQPDYQVSMSNRDTPVTPTTH